MADPATTPAAAAPATRVDRNSWQYDLALGEAATCHKVDQLAVRQEAFAEQVTLDKLVEARKPLNDALVRYANTVLAHVPNAGSIIGAFAVPSPSADVRALRSATASMCAERPNLAQLSKANPELALDEVFAPPTHTLDLR